MSERAHVITFKQFDAACRADWEWRRGFNDTSWYDTPMAGVRQRVHERMRNTALLLGVVVEEPRVRAGIADTETPPDE